MSQGQPESDDSPLFRLEALQHQKQKLLGEIVLISPLPFAILALLSTFAACALVAYLVWGEYTRKAHVSGHLVPDQGLIKVYAPTRGTVTERRVEDRQLVKRGDVLVVLYTERSSASGATQAEIMHQLDSQEKSLRQDLTEKTKLERERADALSTRLGNLEERIRQIDVELDVQNAQVALAEATVTRFQSLQASRFVSEVQLHEKQAALLDQKAKLAALRSSRIALQKEQSDARASLKELPLTSRAERAETERNIASIRRQLAEAAAQKEVVITAPREGVVTATLAYPGQTVTESVPLLSIIPSGTQLHAELYATSRAVGFVKAGNPVLLKYEAYPYQKFGTHDGSVTEVSRSALRAEELPIPSDTADTYYKISVSLKDQSVLAYGHREALQPGMQVKADIMLERRTLLEWVLDPLYSIVGRAREQAPGFSLGPAS